MTTNEHHYCMCISAPPKAASDQTAVSKPRAAILKDFKWTAGASISVRFLEGDAGLQKRVRDVALEWTKIANLQFKFVDTAPSDIRIAFQQGNGSWSYLGTMCRQLEEPQPTMNYGWLTPASDEAEIRRVVLHEFGHAIGLIHEHQNPNGGIKWNRPAVIADLSGPPNNWDEATIENNMFRFYPPDAVIATPVDATSIMMYPIPKAWTLDGFSSGMNRELSDIDKNLVRSAYPK